MVHPSDSRTQEDKHLVWLGRMVHPCDSRTQEDKHLVQLGPMVHTCDSRTQEDTEEECCKYTASYRVRPSLKYPK